MKRGAFYKMKNSFRPIRRVIAFICVIAIACITAGCNNQQGNSSDVLVYEGSEYVPVEYPSDVFYYRYKGNSNDNFEDVDGIYPISSPEWAMLWNAGDLYCSKKQADKANTYYANEDNYEWYVLIDSQQDEAAPYPIKVTSEEIDDVYSVTGKEKDLSVFFDEFEKLGDVYKVSKDGIVCGSITIGKYNGNWYWRSEVVDESRENDGTWAEYVQPLTASLDQKIKSAE